MRCFSQQKKGSFTIEATFLMPLIIGILVFIIYMGFYYYNMGACIYTAYMIAAEGVSGSENLENSKSLKQRTIAMDNPGVEVTEEDDEVMVRASGSQRIPFVNKVLNIETSQRQIVLDQREFILQCRFFEKVLE